MSSWIDWLVPLLVPLQTLALALVVWRCVYLERKAARLEKERRKAQDKSEYLTKTVFYLRDNFYPDLFEKISNALKEYDSI